MDVLVLDKSFTAIGILDSYKSLIWTDRFAEYGDFEIYTVMDSKLEELLQKDYYLWMNDSEHVMIIESVKITTDAEDGNFLTVTGKSLEAILGRRIIWNQKEFKGSLQDAIENMLNEAIIAPAIAERKISNFIFKKSTDPAITTLTIDAQYTGDILYNVIANLCNTNKIGFKIILTEDNKFEFSLYAGKNRSYDQETLPYVVFSPKFDNLINSDYHTSNENYCNVTLVMGEGEGADRKTATVGSGSGLDRRELYTDARDISSMTDDGSEIPAVEYTAKLQERGKEKLAERTIETEFAAEAETNLMYKYGQDFFMGDIVQLEDVYGHTEKVYVKELIFSQEDDSLSVYPTFETTEREED